MRSMVVRGYFRLQESGANEKVKKSPLLQPGDAMNREIKFRGMTLLGEWCYGLLSVLNQNLNHVEPGSYISNSAGAPFAYQVRPETVGQFTGLKDKNGREIYEGDLLSGEFGEQGKEPLEPIIGAVRFGNGSFDIEFGYRSKPLSKINGNHAIYWREDGPYSGNPYFYRIENIEIIGNIYENPDLVTR